MSAISLPERLRGPGLALAILACVLITIGLLIAVVSQLLSAPRQDIARSVDLLAHYRAQGSAKADLEAKLKIARTHLTSFSGFIPATDDTSAAARIQSDVKAIIDTSGGRLQSTASLAPVLRGGLVEIAVKFDFSLAGDHLKDVVTAVESHTPWMSFADITVEAPKTFADSDPKQFNPELQVEWTVKAYRRADRK